jgi:hypothetical protein
MGLLGDIMGAKLQKHQIRHRGDRYRMLDPLGIFGDLMLAQPCSPFQLFDEQSDRPPSPIHVDPLPSAHLGEIGRQDFGLFRPMVPPLFTHNNGDISAVSQTSSFGRGPIGQATAALFERDPIAAIIVFGQMSDQVLQRGNDLVPKPSQQSPPIPLCCGQQPAPMPRSDMAWSQLRQPCDGRFVLADRLAHHQPAEDQVMPMMKHRPEYLRPVAY